MKVINNLLIGYQYRGEAWKEVKSLLLFFAANARARRLFRRPI